MACRAPDTFYVAEQLRDITKCSSKQAEELLAVSKNDLLLAVEKFFAQKVEVEEGNPGDERIGAASNRDIVRADDVLNVRKKHRYDVNKAGDAEDIITTRPRLRRKKSFFKKIATEKKFTFEDMKSEEDLMDEVVAISIAEAYPELDLGSIMVMVRHFRGRQEELLKYVESQVRTSREKVVSRRSCNVIKIKYDSFHMQEFSEFETVREEFLRMTGNKNLKVLAVDIVENRKLEEKFDIQKSVFKAEGLSDLPVLLIAYSDIVDIEEVLMSNFELSLIKIGGTNTIGVHFSETPKVDISTREQSCLIMCLVLEGHPQDLYGTGNVVVTNVDQILPKYVVHFCSQEEGKSSNSELDFWDEEIRCRLGALRF